MIKMAILIVMNAALCYVLGFWAGFTVGKKGKKK